MSSKDTKASPPHRVCLLIRDGWGYSAETKGNAIAAARTPNTDRIAQQYHTTLLSASGTTVGLPEGEMGNSEVRTHGDARLRSQPSSRHPIDCAVSSSLARCGMRGRDCAVSGGSPHDGRGQE